jgi:hypothetical protein
MRKLITVLGFLVLLVNISFAGMLIVDLYSEEGFGVDSRTNQPTKKPLEAAVNNEGYNLDGSEYVTYSWQVGDWQSGGTCGTVTDTRTVMCMGSDGNTYADSNCSGTKPTTTQTRDTGVSCVTYTWNTTNWTPAVDGNSCGVITQTRTVTCLGSDGNTYPDSSCEGVKPTNEQIIDTVKACGVVGSLKVIIGPFHANNTSNGSTITELELYDSNGNRINYSFGDANPYSSYWGSSGWGKYNLNDGDKYYVNNSTGYSSTTLFGYGSKTVIPYFYVTFSGTISRVKLWVGSPERRIPQYVSIVNPATNQEVARYNFQGNEFSVREITLNLQ